jgi:hypothetical protein
MPFDSLGFKPDLSQPSLEGLSYLLRTPEETHGFIWNYAHVLVGKLFGRKKEEGFCWTTGCAIGIAMLQWRDQLQECYEQSADVSIITSCHLHIERLAARLGMTIDSFCSIFLNKDRYRKPYFEMVTRNDVADAIDAYLLANRRNS